MQQLDVQLNSLETLQLIRLFAAQPELEYMFRHELIRDAVYRSSLRNERRRRHRAVGETL